MKPYRMIFVTTLLFICGAACLELAGRDVQAGASLGAALISGIATLATYLSDRQQLRHPQTEQSGDNDVNPSEPVQLAARPLLEQPEPQTAHHHMGRVPYTSHSRA